MPLIAVNGTELYYESRGTGAPLLVIGGLGLDVSEMGMLTGSLAARFRLIAADDGGHLAPLLTRHERLVAEVSAFLTESA